MSFRLDVCLRTSTGFDTGAGCADFVALAPGSFFAPGSSLCPIIAGICLQSERHAQLAALPTSSNLRHDSPRACDLLENKIARIAIGAYRPVGKSLGPSANVQELGLNTLSIEAGRAGAVVDAVELTDDRLCNSRRRRDRTQSGFQSFIMEVHL
jgi:hypothetical protein